jgi:hypothetical protein
LAVLDNEGNLLSKRFGKFQIGFGHVLQSIKTNENTIMAIATHNAEESYSSDSRSTLKITKSDENIVSVELTVEEKGIFGFKTKTKETCVIDQ